MQETTHISYELLTLFLMAGFCGSGVGARGMRSTSDNDTQDPIALWKGLPACVLLRGNIIWSSWQMLPDLMLKYQGKRARREKIELKKKKQAERRGESAARGESSKWERCVVSVSKQNHPAFFQAQLNIKSLWGREIWHSVIFVELQCKRSWEVKTGRRSWAKRTEGVCCCSACWSWAESNLSVLFRATLEVCGKESLKDEAKSSVQNSQGPGRCLAFVVLARGWSWGRCLLCQIYNSQLQWPLFSRDCLVIWEVYSLKREISSGFPMPNYA